MIEIVLVGSRHSSVLRLGHEVAQHPVGGPPYGRDGGDAEPLVDLGPFGVVDPGHHAADAERLPGQPGRDDVGVVAAGDGGERVGPLDPGRDRAPRGRSPCRSRSVPVKSRAEPPEGVGVRVDDRHRVAARLQAVGQRRADPAASHDHDVHDIGSSRRLPPLSHDCTQRVPCRPGIVRADSPASRPAA